MGFANLVNLNGGLVPADTNNTPNAAVIRNADGSINIGQLNAVGVNNTAGTAWNTKSITTATTLDTTATTWLCSASGGAYNATLPAAATCANAILAIVKTDSSGNAVTVKGNGSELINGSNTFALSAQYNSVLVQSNGTQWYILAAH